VIGFPSADGRGQRSATIVHVDTEKIRREHPIAELVSSYGIDLRRAGAALVGRCPFHEDHGRPNLHVYSRSGRWICYRCGERGDAIGFVQQIEHISFLEAAARLEDTNGRSVRQALRQPVRKHRLQRSRAGVALHAEELQVLNAAADLYANRLSTDEAALAYMRRRGFPRHLLEQYRIGYATGDELIPYLRWRRLPLGAAVRTGLLTRDRQEFLTGRITFPETRAGQVIWLIGRVLETEDGQPVVSGPKYLGLPGNKPLLGWEEAIRDRRAVVVVEGPVDLLALRLWGMPGVALVGTMVRPDKLEQLDRFQFIYGRSIPTKAVERERWH
jgi:DNA primase